MIVWLFSFPNFIWYFLVTLLVMSSRVCFSFALVSRMRTSSFHRRHGYPGVCVGDFDS